MKQGGYGKTLCGELIRLRAVEPEDLNFLYDFENDPSLWSVGAGAMPYSRNTLRRYIAQGASDIYADGQMRLIIEDRASGQQAGTIDLINYDVRHRRAELGIAVGAAFRNKGYGSEALDLLEDYVRNFLHLHQLYAYVGAENKASRGLFVKCGYRLVAELPDWVVAPHGYENVVLYQKIL